MEKVRTLRVAAIQLVSANGEIETNLAHAAPFVAEAKRRGAELVLLPELMPGGFEMSDAIWDAAEPAQGATVNWLRQQALQHGVWIGTSFLEAIGMHFHNTFVLMSARGQEVIRVRKARPAAVEAYFFAGRSGSHVADTPLGRIGVSICYEGVLASIMRQLHMEQADLVLMPHSAPTPTLSRGVQPSDIDAYHDFLRNEAAAVARQLGVPTVMANKAGPWKTGAPWPFPVNDSTYPGLSAISDAEGTVLVSLGEQEGVIVADISLNPQKKVKNLSPMRGKWARPVPAFFNLFAIAEMLGSLRYSFSWKRRRLARKIAERARQPAEL